MKKNKLFYSFLILLIVGASCTKDQAGIDENAVATTTATNSLSKIFDITTNNTGIVKITPLGNSATSFIVNYGHGTGASASAVVAPEASTSHAYPEGAYTVSIDAFDVAGNKTTTTYPLTLTYRAPENLVINRPVNGHNVTVSATALYANSYLVYFGDVVNEVGTPMAVGQTLPAHTYAAAGVYNIKVIAQSGGAATTQLIVPVTIYDPFGLPITYENPNVNYFFGTFGGGQQFATVANPNISGLNTSALVGRFTRGFESWSGTYSPLNVSINFATGNKIKVLAYNPDPALIGKKLNVELEAAVAGTGGFGNGNANNISKVAFTTSGAWEELVFDYSATAIATTARYNQLVLRFNDVFNGNGVGGTGSAFYLDNFRFTF